MSVPESATIVQNKLVFNYKDSQIKLENDGHVLNVVVNPGPSMSVAGKEKSESALQYVVFHSPSEHVFTDDSGQDMRFALEMQFHHKSLDGQVVVVSVLFKVNAENPSLNLFLKDIPTKCKDKKIKEKSNLEDLMPFERHFYMYKGGITTPPCTEPATWYVLRQQAHLSMEQLKQLRTKLNLDPVDRPEELKPKPAGTEEGNPKIVVVDLDKFPTYGFSEVLIGNARPLQDFGARTLWATPQVVN